MMVKKVSRNHYVASARVHSPTASAHYLHSHGLSRGYSTDEESGRTMSEYGGGVRNGLVDSYPGVRPGRSRSRSRERERRDYGQYTDQEGSDIYIASPAYPHHPHPHPPPQPHHPHHPSPSEYSRGSRRSGAQYSYRSGVGAGSEGSVARVHRKVDAKRGLLVETTVAGNPACPHTRGLCCLMVLVNLAMGLVCLGFVIVIHLYQPTSVWVLGIVFLVFGFLTLLGSLVYCVTMCRASSDPGRPDPGWSRTWAKTLGTPHSDIHYNSTDKFHTHPRTRY